MDQFTLIIKNYKCWGDEKVIVFDRGLTHLSGESGSGKTTIFEAIFYCLYGGNVKNLKKDEKHTSVCMKFPTFSITRSKPPEKVHVKLFDKNIDLYGEDAKNYIYQLFNSKNVWLSSSYIKQNINHQLITGTSAERMELIESLVYSDCIDDEQRPDYYLDKVSEVKYQSNEKLNLLNAELNVIVRNIDRFKENNPFYLNYGDVDEKSLKQLKKDIIECEEDIKTFVRRSENNVYFNELNSRKEILLNEIDFNINIDELEDRLISLNKNIQDLKDRERLDSLIEIGYSIDKDIKNVSKNLSITSMNNELEELKEKLIQQEQLRKKFIVNNEFSFIFSKKLGLEDEISKIDVKDIELLNEQLRDLDEQLDVLEQDKIDFQNNEILRDIISERDDLEEYINSIQLKSIDELKAFLTKLEQDKVNLNNEKHEINENEKLRLLIEERDSLEFDEEHVQYKIQANRDNQIYEDLRKIGEFNAPLKREKIKNLFVVNEFIDKQEQIYKNLIEYNNLKKTINEDNKRIKMNNSMLEKNYKDDLKKYNEFVKFRKELDSVEHVSLERIDEDDDMTLQYAEDKERLYSMKLKELECPNCKHGLCMEKGKLSKGTMNNEERKKIQIMLDTVLKEMDKRYIKEENDVLIENLKYKLSLINVQDKPIEPIFEELKELIEYNERNVLNNFDKPSMSYQDVKDVLISLSNEKLYRDLNKRINGRNVLNLRDIRNVESEIKSNKIMIENVNKEIQNEKRKYFIKLEKEKDLSSLEDKISLYPPLRDLTNPLKEINSLKGNRDKLMSVIGKENEKLRLIQRKRDEIQCLDDELDCFDQDEILDLLDPRDEINNIKNEIKFIETEIINEKERRVYISEKNKELDKLMEKINKFEHVADIKFSEQLLRQLLKDKSLLEKEINESKQTIIEIAVKKDEISKIDNKLSTMKYYEFKPSIIDELKSELKELNNRIPIFESYITYKNMLKEYNAVNEDIERGNVYLNKISSLYELIKKVSNEHLMEKIQMINDVIADVLSNIFQNPIEVTIETFKELKSKKEKMEINLRILYNGVLYDKVSDLSGGEMERLSLALLIAMNRVVDSKIILLDEIMSGLDGGMKEASLECIRENLNDRIIIHICHDVVDGWYDRVEFV